MTKLEWSIKELFKKKSVMQDALEEMKDIEDNLNGMEIKYRGNYAVIIYADGNKQEARLYIEEDGESYEMSVRFRDLLKNS